jgi:hypothetical protein
MEAPRLHTGAPLHCSSLAAHAFWLQLLFTGKDQQPVPYPHYIAHHCPCRALFSIFSIVILSLSLYFFIENFRSIICKQSNIRKPLIRSKLNIKKLGLSKYWGSRKHRSSSPIHWPYKKKALENKWYKSRNKSIT